jgi:hypothetical protein
MNMSQQTQYHITLSKEEITLISKALTGVMKPRDLQSAQTLGIDILQVLHELAKDRAQITHGALSRAKTFVSPDPDVR